MGKLSLGLAQLPSSTPLYDSLENWLAAEIGEEASYISLSPDTLPNGNLQYGSTLQIKKDNKGYSFLYKNKLLQGQPTELKGYIPKKVYCICVGNRTSYLVELGLDYIPTGLNANVARGILISKKGYQLLESYAYLRPSMMRKVQGHWVMVTLERHTRWTDYTCASVMTWKYTSPFFKSLTAPAEELLYYSNNKKTKERYFFSYPHAPSTYSSAEEEQYYINVGCVER